jgi:hypothetical protein
MPLEIPGIHHLSRNQVQNEKASGNDPRLFYIKLVRKVLCVGLPGRPIVSLTFGPVGIHARQSVNHVDAWGLPAARNSPRLHVEHYPSTCHTPRMS